MPPTLLARHEETLKLAAAPIVLGIAFFLIPLFPAFITLTADAVMDALSEGIDISMNRYNGRSV